MAQQQQQDKRNGITSIVNASVGGGGGGGGDHENQSSRSSSVSSVQPGVSNLIKIYSEASIAKPQRNESVVSTNKHDELIKIFEQAANRNQRQQHYRRISSSPAEIKQPTQVHEEAYEEVTWDNLAHG
jgi:pyruvate carboxylase